MVFYVDVLKPFFFEAYAIYDKMLLLCIHLKQSKNHPYLLLSCAVSVSKTTAYTLEFMEDFSIGYCLIAYIKSVITNNEVRKG